MRHYPPVMWIRSLALLLLVLLLLAMAGCGRVGVTLVERDGADVGWLDASSDLDAQALDAASEPDATDASGQVDASDAAPCLADVDRDGICDEVDNCPGVANAGQADADGDAAGDVCDPCPSDVANDSDGDGACDGVDGCPLDPLAVEPGVCGCAALPPPTGLAGRWAFDELDGLVASDSVGGHAGVLRNFGSSGWVAGQHGNALAFDGVDDQVEIGPLTPGLRALSFWLWPTTLAVPSSVTTWLNPSANGDPNAGWTDPERAYVSDDAYTNGGLLNGTSHDFHGFGIALPEALRITGIEAEVELKTNNPTGTFGIELSWNAGDRYTRTRNEAPLLVSDRYWNFGGPTDGWGHAPWTAAELRDAVFRVRLSKEGINFSPMTPGVDHLRVRVHHEEVTMPRVILSLGPGVRVELNEQTVHTTGFPTGTMVYVDGVPAGPPLDGGFHHVVVLVPSAVTASDLQVGSVSGYPYPLHGAIDELRAYSEPLDPAGIELLRAYPACR